MGRVLSAELHARGLDSFSYNTPSLRTAVHLVDWDSGREIWPPPPPSMAAAFAATSMVPAYNPTDWHNDERRAKAQQQKRQQMADYYARQQIFYVVVVEVPHKKQFLSLCRTQISLEMTTPTSDGGRGMGPRSGPGSLRENRPHFISASREQWFAERTNLF
jgi:hypothetical protein